jgi:hypothetical protein
MILWFEDIEAGRVRTLDEVFPEYADDHQQCDPPGGD